MTAKSPTARLMENLSSTDVVPPVPVWSSRTVAHASSAMRSGTGDQARASDQFSGLIVWIKDNLALNLDINVLAARATMSPRSFHRKFVNDIGDTPARFVETLRLDHAKQLLAVNLSFKEIAAQTGFANAAQFSKAFERRFGVTVGQFRDRHGSF